MIARTRIAPSPTGKIHIGTVKSLLLTWLWSAQNDAEFIFRIDDTDRSRCKKEYLDEIEKLLQVYRITPNKAFKQSDRTDLYQRALKQCLEHDLAYPVYESEEELSDLQQRYKQNGKSAAYKRNKRGEGAGPVYYRFDIGSEDISFNDSLRGKISINLDKISDPVICKPNGEFTYSFASIVDDLTESITMIIRGSDHIDNTCVQLSMLRKMLKAGIFQAKEPKFAHYPLFLYKNAKLSKRTASNLGILEFFHPMAIANYLVLAGTEHFKHYYDDLKDLVKVFRLETSKSNAINLDLNQLEQCQRKAFVKMTFAQLKDWHSTILTEDQWLLIRENVSRLQDILQWERIFNDRDLRFHYVHSKIDADVNKGITNILQALQKGEIQKNPDPQFDKKAREVWRQVQGKMVKEIRVHASEEYLSCRTNLKTEIAQACDGEMTDKVYARINWLRGTKLIRQRLTGQMKGPNLQRIISLMNSEIVESRMNGEKEDDALLQTPVKHTSPKLKHYLSTEIRPCFTDPRSRVSGKLQNFIPINEDEVRIYCCGPTLYDRPHIGNYRCFVSADILFRTMQALYPRVKYVRNITDINDKIDRRALESGKRPQEIIDESRAQFNVDQAKLNILKPTLEPCASDFIPQMIALITDIINKGHAYQDVDGVYLKIDSLDCYDIFRTGRWTTQEGAECRTGPEFKKADFALWRNVKNSNETVWDSPWGSGKPGWHIECTAMSMETLRIPFDIHFGGKDLLFPHHTNECAQAAALGHAEVASHWMHNEFVNVSSENTKMSKSLGNVVDFKNLDCNGCIVRLALIRAHYADPITWSEETLNETTVLYNKWRRILGNHLLKNKIAYPLHEKGFILPEVLKPLAENLNVPLALHILDHRLSDINARENLYLDIIASFEELLGIEFDFEYINKSEILSLVEKRNKLKATKDFVDADEIRKLLKAQNIELQDGSDSTLWYEVVS